MKITTSYLKQLIREAIEESGGRYSRAKAAHNAMKPTNSDISQHAYISPMLDAYENQVPEERRSLRSFKAWFVRNGGLEQFGSTYGE